SARVDRVGLGGSRLIVSNGAGLRLEESEVGAPDEATALGLVAERLAEHGGVGSVAAVGHRVVFGGDRYTESQLITPELLDDLRRLAPLDPEHLPGEIALIDAAGRAVPGVPQVACFDTAFHRGMPRP